MSGQNRLRAHHLLCIPLYQGKGYSPQFCSNMDQMIAALKKVDSGIQIVEGPDGVCRACPNLTWKNEENRPNSQGGKCSPAVCSLDRNEVKSKDQKLIGALKLDTKRLWTWPVLMQHIQLHMTETIFNASCGKCRWYKAGLCSYEQYREALNKEVQA
ncbi:MAG: DUF1284 domain-containing protein [Lachnospiraceae bacterium]|nr:DUF1284 domain-containing protein [Lachnospiraceae bacterium]